MTDATLVSRLRPRPARHATLKPVHRMSRWAVGTLLCVSLGCGVLTGGALRHRHAMSDITAVVPVGNQAMKLYLQAATRDNAANKGQNYVLAAHDAILYRAAMLAQDHSDWTAADAFLRQIGDQRLFGHVLADRYLMRGITADEARAWMAVYRDLPQANDIYALAQHLRGFAVAAIMPPRTAPIHEGGIDYGNAAGFGGDMPSAGAVNSRAGRHLGAIFRDGDPAAMRAAYIAAVKSGKLSNEDAAGLAARTASILFYDGESARARPPAMLAAEAGVPLGMWLAGLTSFQAGNPGEALRDFGTLTQTAGLAAWDHAAAAFWAYRCAHLIGDDAQAQRWLAEAARYPHSFYGFMAANLAGQAGGRSWQVADPTLRDLTELSQRPAGWRALALLQVGRGDLAENELRRIDMGVSRGLRGAALALAERNHMPLLSMQLGGHAARAGEGAIDAAIYPVPPWQPAGGFTVDRALLYALMMRESRFNPIAVSPAGACGLMQLMPATARLMAAGDIGAGCSEALFDPATNMALGQKYVQHLATQAGIGGNLILTLAAYNGGPGNVARWMSPAGRLDPLMFLESLPVRETHDYVEQVMVHYWMYRSRLGEPQTSLQQLAQGQWPSYSVGTMAQALSAVPPAAVRTAAR